MSPLPGSITTVPLFCRRRLHPSNRQRFYVASYRFITGEAARRARREFPVRNEIATYRIQLSSGFTLDHAAAILGI